MNVNTRLTPPQVSKPSQTAPKAEPKDATFSYNPQDPETLTNDSATISGVTDPGNGRPETATVHLTPKKGLFFFGQLIALRDDPNYKLNPNADGNYVLPTEDPHFTGSNSFGAAAKTVDKFNSVMQEVAGKQINWAFGEAQLGVSPETGEWPNAFYAREQKGVHLFDVKNTSTGNSGEVVSHEVGHAILDALRPSFLGGTGPETGAFHEAFGDVLAMLMTLDNEGAVDKIVEQTGGDLSKNRNILSDMGEGFGQAIGREGGIRTSFNEFKYQDPATLPERGDDTHLGREVHDFSRLWSGAFYDTLDAIADANRAEGMSPKQALMAAGAEGFRLLIGQMEKAPQSSEATFKDMAKAMMQGDQEFNGGKRQDLIRDVMTKRELLPQGEGLFKSLSFELSGTPVVKTTTLGDDFGALAGVKMEHVVDQPVFSAFAAGSNGLGDIATNAVTAEAQKGVKMMMADGDILFTDSAKPGLDEIFRPDGTAFKAYVTTDEAGNRELHRIPMALCSFGDDHDHQGHVHA